MAESEPLIVKVPQSDWNGRAADIRSRLVTWQWKLKLPPDRTGVVLDFTKVRFMEPWAMAMFATYGLEMRRQGVAVKSAFSPENPANQYLIAMGLEELLESGSSAATAGKWLASQSNTGLFIVRDYSDLRRFKASADRLSLQHCPEAADSLRYAMDELGRNVIQHSLSKVGGICIAQHFPDDARLQIAVCDLGQGILSHIRRQNPELQTDLEALRLAVLPHASGATPSGPYGGEQNSGLGLFCSSELAWRARGSLWIASGRGLLGIRGDVETAIARGQPTRAYRTIETWPGTLVVLDFKTDAASSLSNVLDECSKLAAEARRMAGPAGLDFLDEDADVEAVKTIRVREFEGDNDVAIRLRSEEIMPRLQRGESLVLDFAGVRAPAQSFVHALLAEPFSVRGSLVRLSFAHCAPSARAVLKMVAAYASYRRVVE